jgi:serine/threonine-protein kinase
MSDAGRGAAGRIDAICDRFETAWRNGARPPIEPFLAQVPAEERPALLRALVLRDVAHRSRSGEQPRIEEYRARFPTLTAAVEEAFQTAAEPPGPTLTVIEGPHQGLSFRLTGHDAFIVGRSRHAHFRLPSKDRYFSRVHFMVEANPPLCRLTDMGSHNGTYVNGRRVTAADLRDGDLIRAGHTTLRVSLPPGPPGEAATVPPAASPSEAATVTHRPLASSGPLTTGWHNDVSTMQPPAPALPAIAGHEIVRELGRGGMGVVYLARRLADGAPVAIKTIVPAVAASATQVERFLREARILCELKHKHIVAFREMGESEGLLYFAMDYVDGTDADRLLKGHGPLPVRTATRIVCQVLSGLEYAHDRGFVHRDIKPANVLLADEEERRTVKIADFGLARVYQASQLSGLTLQGQVGGTVAFMPPEQVTHFRDVKPAADQYAAAATLYMLLTGKYVQDFPRESALALAQILDEEPVPIRERRSDVPATLAALIHKALARDPADRYPDVAAFRAALLPFAR